MTTGNKQLHSTAHRENDSCRFCGVFVVFLTITVATFFVHMLLCKVFKIDLRLMMVTATAGIYGPAFIPGLCKALDSDKLIPSGLIMGSLGYVIGTFLGCGLVLLL